MLGNYNIPTLKTSKVKLFDFSNGMNGQIDEKIAPPTLAERTYNFSLSDGALTEGVGVSDFSIITPLKVSYPRLPDNIIPEKSFYFKHYDNNLETYDDRLLVYANDGYIYESDLSEAETEMTRINELYFESKPNSVCYKYNGDDCIIFSTAGGLKMYDGENVTTVSGVPDITSMCIHSERLFITTGGERTSLWFSDDFDPLDWFVSLSEAGFIDLQDGRGSLLKVISFNGYVYAFRNYGISRLSAYGDQTEFYVTGLFLSSGKIFSGSIVDCGKSVIYLSEDGFYSFDGMYSTKILKGLDKYLSGIDNKNAVGRYFNGKLYMAVNLKFGKKTEKTLVVYDTDKGHYYISKGLRVKDIEICYADGYCLPVVLTEGSNKIGTFCKGARLFSKQLNKLWKSNFSDCGIEGKKVLKEISLFSETPTTIKIESNEGERQVETIASKSKQRLKIGVKGEVFSISFLTKNPKAKISKVLISFYTF